MSSELLSGISGLLDEEELLEVTIKETLLDDDEFFASSVELENKTMKTPAQIPRRTIIINMYITIIERGILGVGIFPL